MNSTIWDIAKITGVSASTVSRVVNNYPFVKETTRKKVLQAIEELNYYPDLVAKSMKKGRTYNIGLIVGGLRNPFFAETSEVIVKTAEKYNYHVTLCVTEEKALKVKEYINLLIKMRVDGVIIGSISNDAPINRLRDSKIPYVLYNRRNEHKDSDYIIQDNSKGAFDAVSHLINLGHKRIGMLHGPLSFDTVEGRTAGYYEALNTYKLKQYDHFVQEVDFVEAETKVEQAVNKMFDNKIKPTAIFTTADILALDAMEVLMRYGYRVPKDVAMVGFDNIRLSGHSLIGLTTVGHRAAEMARLAAERLVQKIEYKDNNDHPLDPWNITLQPELMIRRSCGSSLKKYTEKSAGGLTI
jgi:LacI family transcriptional regulator